MHSGLLLNVRCNVEYRCGTSFSRNTPKAEHHRRQQWNSTSSNISSSTSLFLMHKKNRNQSIFYHDVVTQHVLTVIMHHFVLTNLLKRESLFFWCGTKKQNCTWTETSPSRSQDHSTNGCVEKGQKRWCTFLRLFFLRSDNDLCSLLWSLWA